MKVLGINGSARKDGNTAIIMNKVQGWGFRGGTSQRRDYRMAG